MTTPRSRPRVEGDQEEPEHGGRPTPTECRHEVGLHGGGGLGQGVTTAVMEASIDTGGGHGCMVTRVGASTEMTSQGVLAASPTHDRGSYGCRCQWQQDPDVPMSSAPAPG